MTKKATGELRMLDSHPQSASQVYEEAFPNLPAPIKTPYLSCQRPGRDGGKEVVLNT